MAATMAPRRLPTERDTTRAATEDIPLVQSRETGDIIPESRQAGPIATNKASPFAASWAHFVAGGVAGMTAATLTAPLDVLKTRLQSDFYQAQLRAARAHHPLVPTHPLRAIGYHLAETGQILGSVYRLEGIRGLFKGLGPTLVGVVPARSVSFFTYGNGKRLIAQHLNGGQEAAWVHLTAAAVAGITTSTVTNPIWVVKTRLQLAKGLAAGGQRQYKGSWDCIVQILRTEGVKGMYKGMSASYLGVTESTLQWVLYEQGKKALELREERIVNSGREKTWWDRTVDLTGNLMAGGGAKLVAAVLAYPHEVARTRLRQAPMADGRLKYTGLAQCFKLVWREEGMLGLYGGLTPHLLRTVPSAAIMFAMYEGMLTHVFNVK